MKKLFSLIAAIIILSCSTSSDDNGNSTTAVVPLAPTELDGALVNNQVELTWVDNSTNETGFKIDRKVGAGNWVADYASVNADVVNYTDTSVSEGMIYSYRASSFNAVGKSLNYSNTYTVTINSATVIPLSPTNLNGTVVSATQINLSWTDLSTNESGFKIERKVVGGNYALIGTVPADITNFSDSGVPVNSNFLYRVYAYNAIGTSLTYTNEVAVANFLPTVTTAPVNFLSYNSALGGGNVTFDGGSYIMSKGVVWSTSPNPTIALTNKTNEGPNAGSYTSILNLSTGDGNYYVRAYVTNSVGTSYGAEVIYNKHSPTYEFDIKPIMITSCISCHSQGNQYPDLDSYPSVKDSFSNGTSLCRLVSTTCGNIMPLAAPLPQSQINMITTWINNGFIEQ